MEMITKGNKMKELFERLHGLGIKRVLTRVPFQGYNVSGRMDIVELGLYRLVLNCNGDLIECKYKATDNGIMCIIESIKSDGGGYKGYSNEMYLGIRKHFYIRGNEVINAKVREDVLFNWVIDI